MMVVHDGGPVIKKESLVTSHKLLSKNVPRQRPDGAAQDGFLNKLQ